MVITSLVIKKLQVQIKIGCSKPIKCFTFFMAISSNAENMEKLEHIPWLLDTSVTGLS